MAELKLKNIYKRYAGGVTAVTDFNFFHSVLVASISVIT